MKGLLLKHYLHLLNYSHNVMSMVIKVYDNTDAYHGRNVAKVSKDNTENRCCVGKDVEIGNNGHNSLPGRMLRTQKHRLESHSQNWIEE